MFITSQKRTSAELATELTPHSIETGMRLISDSVLARELELLLMQMHWVTVIVRSWKG